MRRGRAPFGLRPRLLAALLLTAAVTLAAAALALLPPLQDQLREQSAAGLEGATEADAPVFQRELRESLRRTRGQPAQVRRDDQTFEVQRAAVLLRQRSDARVLVAATAPDEAGSYQIYDTDNGAPFPQRQVLRALISGEDVRTLTDDQVTLVRQLFVGRGRDRFLLVTQKQLTDVAAAVDRVRTAFLTAAGVGLAAALVLGIALSTTLTRRLGRLRAAALRVTAEGPDAPAPRDTGRDEVGDLARALAAMQEALRREETPRRTFVSTASHELRTPLTSLQGTLELLGEDLEDPNLDVEEARRQVAGAEVQLRRLGRLAAELLDLSRLDAHVELFRAEPVELGELARAVAAEFELRAAEIDVAIDVVAPPGPCWARGDPSAAARVVRILLDNALRFSPPGAAVRVAAAYRGEHAGVEVSDAGPGVPAEDRERIFERFQRGRETGGEGGFGLGLAIGRELAQRQGGTLELAPAAPGAGARFVLTLPIELPAGSHRAAQTAEPVGPRE